MMKNSLSLSLEQAHNFNFQRRTKVLPTHRPCLARAHGSFHVTQLATCLHQHADRFVRVRHGEIGHGPQANLGMAKAGMASPSKQRIKKQPLDPRKRFLFHVISCSDFTYSQTIFHGKQNSDLATITFPTNQFWLPEGAWLMVRPQSGSPTWIDPNIKS